MPINIHGNEYVTVAERVQAVHELKKLDITTEVLSHTPSVVVKATVVTDKGTFTGISAANPLKAIEKMSPYEVAETSAVGRALGFAGYGVIDSIATADEIVKASPDKIMDKSFSKSDLRDSLRHTACNECGTVVSPAVEKFSIETYGNVLCFTCQKKYKSLKEENEKTI